MSRPRPPVLFITSAAKSKERESKTWRTPRDSRNARFSLLPAVVKISAPARRATWTAANPTPPEAAWIRTLSPDRSPPTSCIAYQAVMNAAGSVTASSGVSASGLGAT